MKKRTKWVLSGSVGTLLTLALAGLLVVLLGVAPISASSGHWGITEWFLKFSMRRVVSTQSMGVKAPPNLDDPGMILRGARHYDSGCRFCHGMPGERLPPVPAKATPAPPRLEEPARELSDPELFWVVKHGVKFTAMPAWQALERDDEVWSMVAFVRTLPSLDEAGYRELAAARPPAPPDVPDVVERMCARCHGVDGRGVGEGAFPRLAGQKEEYLAASLQAYASGERPSGMMEPVAALLEEAQVRRAASYYSALEPMRPATPGEPLGKLAERGARIVHEGIADERVPACAHCHGPTTHPTKGVYPLLAGQAHWYLVAQLELFRKGARGGTEYSHLMKEAASHNLDDDAIEAVAAYYAGLLDSEIIQTAGTDR